MGGAGRRGGEAAVIQPLAARLSRAMVRCYPHRWKQRYRDEILNVPD